MALSTHETFNYLDHSFARSATSLKRPESSRNNVIHLPQRRSFPAVDDRGLEPAGAPASSDLSLTDFEPRSTQSGKTQRHEATDIVSHLVTFVSIASLEAVAGQRSMTQLQRFVSAAVFEKLKRRAELLASTSSPMGSRVHTLRTAEGRKPSRIAHVRSVRVCNISDRVFEAVAIIQDQERVRPIAMRVEFHRNNWRVTHYEVG